MPRPSRLSEDEVTRRLPGVSGWKRTGEKLERTYTFKTFPEGIAFVNRVAEIAESLDHHPDITINYTKVTLAVTTHDASGLTENDFTLASRIDA